MEKAKIVWTKTDEAPMLATYSFLPVVNAFLKHGGVEVETRDISLANRILSLFPERLKDDQKVSDDLAYLGELVNKPEANVIKLPNISASVPQLQAAIKELQEKGYDVPDYPENPQTDEEKELAARYAKALGSAVNPVLRQGNSDRRAPAAVKKIAQKYPTSMGLPLQPWSSDSKTRVSHMTDNDFYGNEKSVIMDKETDVKFEFVDKNGNVTVLKDKLHLLKDEVFDATFMNVKAMKKFFEEQIEQTKKDDILLSLHLKATMMKISDPPIFGHAVRTYFKDVFEKYGDLFDEIGVNTNNGLSDVYAKIKKLPEDKQKEIEDAINAVYEKNPKLAMVNSAKGITNLHMPNDVIIDASMPVVIRDGGKMWGPDNELHDTNAMIPDRCYSTLYEVAVDDCRVNGAFDRSTMGSVSNVGLMAMKAEEYGSHDKTFIAPDNGTIRVVDADGNVIFEHNVEKDDIWRATQAKDIAIKDWVKLAVSRARATKDPAVFWLDKNRAHDASVIEKVEKYLKDHDTDGLEIHIMAPPEAMKYTIERTRKGLNTISVSGNAIRDYLTDLFPILEIGTSAKMLSIVPLLAGGGLFETGAGGSAPKHIQQLLDEGHLRWDSLGEFTALWASLDFIYNNNKDEKINVLADALDKAVEDVLENKKWPSRKVGELDNRGSHYYLSMYWAKALSEQSSDKELKDIFTNVYKQLADNEDKINKELLEAQGKPVDIGGYYKPNEEKTAKAMRASATFNSIIDAI
jgi:isocitrate dehydrogenase